jgi:hypothetical protein
MEDTFPDLGSLTDLELKDVVRQPAEEEAAGASAFRRVGVRPSSAGRLPTA